MFETNPDLAPTQLSAIVKSIAMSPNIFGLATKKFIHSSLASEFFSSQLHHNDSYRLQIFGSLDFEWRLTNAVYENMNYVLVMRKFEPWRKNVSEFILRITEGQLLFPAKPRNHLPVNKNPHA